MLFGNLQRWLKKLSRNNRGRAARHKRARPTRPVLELLEGRALMAGLYVDDNFADFITSENGLAGLNDGDVVTWTPSAGSAHGPMSGLIFGENAFTSIQSAVDHAAQTGDTIYVAAGTYVGQVDISKTLTVEAEGHDAVIKSPASLAQSFTTPNGSYKAVIYVHDTDGVTLRGLTVDGDDQGNSNLPFHFVGIAYYNAGGTIDGVEVMNFRDTRFGEMQTGTGIYGHADVASKHTLYLTGNSVHDYQKNGITMSGAGLTAHVTDNTITGTGATNQVAQNGIVFRGGATGTIVGNTVSDHQYIGANTAAGILLYGGSAAVNNNRITANDVGIDVTSGGILTSATENFITGNTDGILIADTAGSVGPVHNNDLSNNGLGIHNESGTTVDATGNWWGTNGAAAEISGDVDSNSSLLTGKDASLEPGFQGFVSSPAGNVRVRVVGKRLMITGDNLDNWITVEKLAAPNSYRVTGLNGTKINGLTSRVFKNVTNGIDANLLGGNDQLVLDGSARRFKVPGLIKVRTGDGNDLVQFKGVTGTGNLSSLSGQDSIELIDSYFSSLAVDMGNGGNGASTSLLLDGVTVGGRTAVRGGNGDDTILAVNSVFNKSLVGSRLGAAVQILTGSGHDTVSLKGVRAARGVVVDGQVVSNKGYLDAVDAVFNNF